MQITDCLQWSTKGPWHQHRTLFGLNEFAGIITTLAMQKQNVDIRSKTLPSCVFQLQCIVDAFTVSRGWSISALRDHILTPPPADFQPRRDINLFLDREGEREHHGFCCGFAVLVRFMKEDAKLQGDPTRHELALNILEEVKMDFLECLGESKYKDGLDTIPPSRFSNSNSNGLWEYSPFLCGVGLSEALETAYCLGMKLWDDIPEASCIIHLHNFLVVKGYISKPIALYASLQNIFSASNFAKTGGWAPTSEFLPSLIAVISPTPTHRETATRRAALRSILRADPIVRNLLEPSNNRIFKDKSMLTLF